MTKSAEAQERAIYRIKARFIETNAGSRQDADDRDQARYLQSLSYARTVEPAWLCRAAQLFLDNKQSYLALTVIKLGLEADEARDLVRAAPHV